MEGGGPGHLCTTTATAVLTAVRVATSTTTTNTSTRRMSSVRSRLSCTIRYFTRYNAVSPFVPLCWYPLDVLSWPGIGKLSWY